MLCSSVDDVKIFRNFDELFLHGVGYMSDQFGRRLS